MLCNLVQITLNIFVFLGERLTLEVEGSVFDELSLGPVREPHEVDIVH